MRKDTRLSRSLHVLIHMADQQPMTSAQIARILQTNSVVVRRTMAGLREAGLVESKGGRGGGWSLLRGLEAITLLEVHNAVSGDALFCIGWGSEHSGCLVEAAVNQHIGEALEAAEALLLERLGAVTLAQIRADMDSEQWAGFRAALSGPGAPRT